MDNLSNEYITMVKLFRLDHIFLLNSNSLEVEIQIKKKREISQVLRHCASPFVPPQPSSNDCFPFSGSLVPIYKRN